MQGPPSLETPRPSPDAIRLLCHRLEEQGIAVWSHGDDLLRRLRAPAAELRESAEQDGNGRGPTDRAFLCQTDSAALLALLPTAVVTASAERRLTLPTAVGPIDLLPVGTKPLDGVLIDFGLGALGFAWREAHSAWADPVAARADFARGHMSPTRSEPNPFVQAPRRYWIGARLLAEQGLAASTELIETARAALEPSAETLPLGAPARREIARVLSAPEPERGLDFLAESGLSARLFPGIEHRSGSIVGRLPALPALRWAAWLQGCPLQRALIALRMPPGLARAIARLQRAHPLDQTLARGREPGLRKLLQRFEPEEIDGLLAWRQCEIEGASDAPALHERLAALRARIDAARKEGDHARRRKTLALDGQAVMALLDSGPGPHVGQALAHLARFVESHPEANERASLEAELRRWAKRADDPIGSSPSSERMG